MSVNVNERLVMPDQFQKNEPAPWTAHDTRSVKMPYQTPGLRTYGAVNQLTAGNGGSKSNGMSMNPMM